MKRSIIMKRAILTFLISLLFAAIVTFVVGLMLQKEFREINTGYNKEVFALTAVVNAYKCPKLRKGEVKILEEAPLGAEYLGMIEEKVDSISLFCLSEVRAKINERLKARVMRLGANAIVQRSLLLTKTDVGHGIGLAY